MQILKPITYDNEKYLTWIRGQTCGVWGCGKIGEPHHVRRQRWGAGASKRSHDYVAIARCRQYHIPQYDNFGELMSVELEIIENLMKYIEHLRQGN